MKTTTIGGTTMLTNGQGFTLYWFAPIPRPGRPATGPAAVLAAGDRRPTAGPGVTGRFGAITWSDGSTRPTTAGIRCTPMSPTPARANQWQQPQLELWPVARSHHAPIGPRQNTVATPPLIPDGGSSSACPGVTLIRRHGGEFRIEAPGRHRKLDHASPQPGSRRFRPSTRNGSHRLYAPASLKSPLTTGPDNSAIAA